MTRRGQANDSGKPTEHERDKIWVCQAMKLQDGGKAVQADGGRVVGARRRGHVAVEEAYVYGRIG